MSEEAEKRAMDGFKTSSDACAAGHEYHVMNEWLRFHHDSAFCQSQTDGFRQQQVVGLCCIFRIKS